MSAFLVNGVDLTTFATRIATAEGLQDTPAPEAGLVSLYAADGAYDPYGGVGQPRPPDGTGSITFDMWLAGVDPVTGAVPAFTGTANAYYRQWDTLVRLFHRRQLTIDFVGPVGTRRAVGRLTSGMKPSRERSSPWFGRFQASVAIPGAHWTDLATVTTGAVALASGGTLSLAAFAGATAPCTELLVRLGAASNPRLTTSTGAYVGWNGVIAAGRQVEFATATGRIGPGTGTAWTPGYAPGSHAWFPGPRFLEVDPSEPLTATLTHTGGGTATVEVLGKRRYRTSGGG